MHRQANDGVDLIGPQIKCLVPDLDRSRAKALGLGLANRKDQGIAERAEIADADISTVATVIERLEQRVVVGADDKRRVGNERHLGRHVQSQRGSSLRNGLRIARYCTEFIER